MELQPRIEILSEKKLVGKRIRMSLSDNRTGELWRSFMPGRNEISNNLTNELISMQVYNEPLIPGDLNQKFEILGEKYKNGDPNSEEEIWIPVKLKE